MEDTKSQSRNPVLLEERNDFESFSQTETLTEAQSEVMSRISNKKLASRLHTRTLKIFKREERLKAIEFYRIHVHINPRTGEEHNLSIASAAEALHISSGTLERWINEEQRITSMKHGSSRDDSQILASVPASERFMSGNYPFLRLTPRQLFARNYIKGKDFYNLHSIDHPIPFIGIEGGRRGRIESFADAYRFLGHAEDTVHYGHPQEPRSDLKALSQKHTTGATVPGPKISPSEHMLRSESTRVQEVNTLLYHLAPDYNLRQVGSGQCTPCSEQLRACVSLVCEQFEASSNKLESAMLIRIGFDYVRPFVGAPTHWAIKLLLEAKAEIFLPLSLCLRGSTKHEVMPDKWIWADLRG